MKFIPTLRVIVTAKKHYDSNVGEKEDGKEERKKEKGKGKKRETGWGEEGGKRKSLFERKCEYNKRIDWFCRGYAPIGLHSARKKAANNFSIVD